MRAFCVLRVCVSILYDACVTVCLRAHDRECVRYMFAMPRFSICLCVRTRSALLLVFLSVVCLRACYVSYKLISVSVWAIRRCNWGGETFCLTLSSGHWPIMNRCPQKKDFSQILKKTLSPLAKKKLFFAWSKPNGGKMRNEIKKTSPLVRTRARGAFFTANFDPLAKTFLKEH